MGLLVGSIKTGMVFAIQPDAQISSPRNTTPATAKLPDSSLAWVLTRECIRHLSQTADEEIPVVMEESAHPYTPETRVRKMIRIDGTYSTLRVLQCRVGKVIGHFR